MMWLYSHASIDHIYVTPLPENGQWTYVLTLTLLRNNLKNQLLKITSCVNRIH